MLVGAAGPPDASRPTAPDAGRRALIASQIPPSIARKPEDADDDELGRHTGDEQPEPDEQADDTDRDAPAVARAPAGAAHAGGELGVLCIERAFHLLEQALFVLGEWHGDLLLGVANGLTQHRIGRVCRIGNPNRHVTCDQLVRRWTARPFRRLPEAVPGPAGRRQRHGRAAAVPGGRCPSRTWPTACRRPPPPHATPDPGHRGPAATRPRRSRGSPRPGRRRAGSARDPGAGPGTAPGPRGRSRGWSRWAPCACATG